MGIRDGHRERMRERFFQHGLENFNEIEALEMLLYYAIPRKDTNPIAHALLDRFGSLDEVLHATEEELCEIPEISRRTAALLRMVPQLVRLSEVGRAARITTIKSTEDAVNFLRPRFLGERDEIMVLACLDAQNRVTYVETVNRGVVNAVLFDPRRVVETALKRKAVSVLIAHNHPDGPALPSHEDDTATGQIYRALQMVNITLYDHIVLAGEEYASYRRSGAMDLFQYRY
ncbi:MAG: DNA repair protein RadC [Oscillospiraceae bacterium]|nr:DNA repair protein RadC [Oscillospiraceae bacterium]